VLASSSLSARGGARDDFLRVRSYHRNSSVHALCTAAPRGAVSTAVRRAHATRTRRARLRARVFAAVLVLVCAVARRAEW
jgi:hypothetical protein